MPEIKLTFIQRTVDAPDKEYLTKPEASKWIGISQKLFQILVDEGHITQPEIIGDRKQFWHWTQILAYLSTRNRGKPPPR